MAHSDPADPAATGRENSNLKIEEKLNFLSPTKFTCPQIQKGKPMEVYFHSQTYVFL